MSHDKQLAIEETAAMEMGAPLANRLLRVPGEPYNDAPSRDYSLAEIEALEAKLLRAPQVEVPLTNIFAPHVYWREVRMPAGSFIIGHRHKTEHLNVILTGKARVMMDGKLHDIVAPAVIKSGPNVRKILYIEEEMRWATVHPTDTTDLEELAEELIVKSDSFLAHEAERRELAEFQAMLGDERDAYNEQPKELETQPCLG